jgi:Ulp1 family protease
MQTYLPAQKCSSRGCQRRRTGSWHTSTSIDFHAKRISWYYSSRFNHQSESNTLFKWLQREYASLCADSDNIGITNWSVDSGPPPRTSMPTQENSYDCGVFEYLYVAHITIQKPFTFTQTDINDVRLWMAENRTEAIGGEDPRLHQISKKVLVDMP